MNLAIDLAWIGLMGYISIIDIKTHTIEDRHNLIAAILALISAILRGYGLGQILVYALPFPLMLILIAMIYERVTRNKREEGEYPYGIGGGDIKIAPAIGLFSGPYILEALFNSFILAFIVGIIIKRQKEIPLAPYLSAGTIVMWIVSNVII